MAVDWMALKIEYMTSDMSLRKISEKYGVSHTTLCQRAKKEKWAEERRTNKNKTIQKIQEEVEKNEVERAKKILSLSDQLTEKIEQAIKELDIYMSTKKKKTKEVKYKSYGGIAKPIKEDVVEEEELIERKSIVNVMALRQLSEALRTVKEIQLGILQDEDEVEDSGLLSAIREASEGLDICDDAELLPQEES